MALLDIGLPVTNGWELARRIRELPDPECRDARLFAVTGYGPESDLRKSREAGFDAHFVKPVDLDEMSRAVENASITAP